MKYQQEEISNLQNTPSKKFQISRKRFRSVKYPQETILKPRNTHRKKIWTTDKPRKKYFGPTKYPQEDILQL